MKRRRASTRLIQWIAALVVLTAAGAVGYYAYTRVDDEVRSVVERRFAEHYAGLKVSVRSARVVQGQGIEIRGLSIIEPAADGPRAELLYVDEIFVRCRTGLHDLVRNHLQVQDVVLRRMVMRATLRESGAWSIQQLFPLPEFGDDSPTTTIEDATLVIVDEQRSPATVFTLHDIDATITPQLRDPQSVAAVDGVDPPLRLEGTLRGDHFASLEAAGEYDPADGSYEVGGKLSAVAISPQVRDSLPTFISHRLAPLDAIQGTAYCDFQVSGLMDSTEPPRFRVGGRMAGGTVRDPRLPLRLTDVRADFSASNGGWKIERLTAQSGPAAIELSASGRGFAASSPLLVRGHARRLLLSPSLLGNLPKEMIRKVVEYEPHGVVDLDAELTFDGRRLRKQLVMKCHDLAFTSPDFRYPLREGRGRIALQDNQLSIDLTAKASGTPVKIEGQINDPAGQATGFVEVRTEGTIPIDEKLIAALPPNSQKVVRMFEPSGRVRLHGILRREDPGDTEVEKHLFVDVREMAVRFEHFAYPIHRIRGRLEMHDDQWQIRDFQGVNDRGYYTMNGHAETRGGHVRLGLKLTGSDMPLEDELRDALPSRTQRLWNDLRLRGAIDHMAADVRYDSARDDLSLDIRLQKWPRKPGQETHPISVKAVGFPYQLDNVVGLVRYRDGRVTLENLRAQHNEVQVTLDGSVDIAERGGWRLKFDRIVADGIRAGHDLTAALPRRLGEAIASINPRGAANLQGSMEFESTGRHGDPLRSKWDLTIDVADAQFNAGVQLQHVYGEVHLTGGSDGRRSTTRGRLKVDSLMWEGIQLTGITGPVWIDDERIALGAWARPRGDGQVPPRLEGRLFGGRLTGDIQVAFGQVPTFHIQGELTGADLALVARHHRLQEQIRGRANAALRLSGTARGSHTWKGTGNIQLRQADIYELPLMVSLLKILSIKTPDRTAFTEANIDMQINGPHFYFTRIDFSGDAITLKGKGDMNLRRQINLQFYTKVGRDGWQIPIVQPLIGEASRQVLLIYITGTLDKPITRTQTFPGLNEVLQTLFPEDASSVDHTRYGRTRETQR